MHRDWSLPEVEAESNGFRIGGIVIRYGEQAPVTGPARANWCLSHGLEEWHQGRRELSIALRTLVSVVPGGIDRLPRPMVLQSGTGQTLEDPLVVGRRRVHQWFALRHEVDRFITNANEPDRRLLNAILSSADKAARRALERSCNAYNYLDDLRYEYVDSLFEVGPKDLRPLTWLLDRAHLQVHRCGEVVGGLFGCYMEFSDGHWYDTCPVSLLHLRFGQSAGFTARYVCNICDESAGDCAHSPGLIYPRIAEVIDGRCCICLDQCERHEHGVAYEVVAGFHPVDIDFQEVSLVARPRDPLTRITKRSANRSNMISSLGSVPTSEIPLLDHGCMYVCEGFRYLDEDTISETNDKAETQLP